MPSAAPGWFQQLNPLTKLTLAGTLLGLAYIGPGRHLALGLFLLGVVPLSLSAGVARPVLKVSYQLGLPAGAMLFFFQGLVYPGAHTVVWALGPLAFKAEGLWYAYQLTTRLLVMAGAIALLLHTTPPGDLMTVLEQKGMPSGPAYVLVASLQVIPETRDRAASIVAAQRARGLRTGGNLLQRSRALLPLLTPLIFGALLMAGERALALDARGFNSGLRPVPWKKIPDSRGQQAARWLCLALFAAAGVSRLWL